MNDDPQKKFIRIKNDPEQNIANNLLYVLEVGYLPTELTGTVKKNYSDSYIVIFILKGTGIVRFNGKEYSASEGQCIFLDCHYEHFYSSSQDNPWEVLWLRFNGSSAKYYYDMFCKNHDCVFIPQYMNDLTALTRELITNNSHRSDDAEIINAKLITDILTLIISGSNIREMNKHQGYPMRPVKEYIDTHFVENIKLDEISEVFFMSKYYITREFKKEYGETIFQHIINRRIDYAKELLIATNKSINEISAICGFNDQHYFSRQFKKITGYTPMNYSKMHK